MKSKVIITLLIAMLSIVGYAKNRTVVWNEVEVETNKYWDVNNGSKIEITRVELADDETRIWLHVETLPEYWFRIEKSMELRTGDKRYPIKRIDKMELGKEKYFRDTNWKDDIVLSFEPLPSNTTTFDFIEGDGDNFYNIYGVHNSKKAKNELITSNWRNEKTGDWEIGFYEDFAIYDCKYWNYKKKVKSGDKYSIVLVNGDTELTVSVGKNNGGKRAITIGNRKNEYSLINGSTVGDYPDKEWNASLKDSHYVIDTITLRGWIKNMPEDVKAKGNEFAVIYDDIFTGKQKSIRCKMDSLGRFELKCPFINTTEVYFDMAHIRERNVLEPGETYYFLYDFKQGKKLFMGSSSRLQNEIMAHDIMWSSNRLRERNLDAHELLEGLKNDKQKKIEEINRIVAEHPTVSERYINYMKEMIRVREGRDLMQGRFYIKNRNVPDDYLEYVGDTHWQKRTKPYTVYGDFTTFIRDYIDQLAHKRYNVDRGEYFLITDEYAKRYILKKYSEEGKLSITDDDLALMLRYADGYKEKMNKIDDENIEELRLIVKEFDEQEYVKQYNRLMEREDIKKILEEEESMLTIYNSLMILDSIGCDQDLRDIIIAKYLFKELDHDCKPLSEIAMRYLEDNVRMPAAKAFVKAENDKYLALQRRDITNSKSLKSAVDVSEMSDGEKILRKMIEPHKGKIILLDIWGTWCGPCKEALSHSAEEYERLKDYDMVFMYLANRSPEESWKNVIKEYNVLGDNVVHYNLPEDQQNAIQSFLDVRSFPTYKLIDRDGNILEINADARDLERLAGIVEQIK